MQLPVTLEVTAVAERTRAQVALVWTFPRVDSIMATCFGTRCAGFSADVTFVRAKVAFAKRG